MPARKPLIFGVSDKKAPKDEACEILKIKEFTDVNDCFQNEHNEVFGVFLQRLTNFYDYILPAISITLL